MQESERNRARASTTGNGPPTSTGKRPFPTCPLSIVDSLGQRRHGRVVLLPRWAGDNAIPADPAQDDFRIIILRQPPEEQIRPSRGTAVCIPAQELSRPTAVRDAAVTYEVRGRRRSLPLLTAADIRLLAEGELLATSELTVKPADIFRGDKALLELLAKDLLTCEGLDEYLEPLAAVLSAPAPPGPTSCQETLTCLTSLVRAVGPAVDRGEGEAPPPEARDALQRLSQVIAAEDRPALLATLRRLYPSVRGLLEDTFLLRGLQERPRETLELLRMRHFLAEAAVPPGDSDLALDKTIAQEQLHSSTLVAEPQRLASARAALEHFRQRYRRRYEAHHRAYWTEMARLHSRLREARRHVAALGKLNTLTELGPPVGQGAVVAYQELLRETAGCPLVVGVDEELTDSALCPACRLRMDQEPPIGYVNEILDRIERAIARQLTRLSSTAIQQVLKRSGDARIEQFLKVVQAAQLSSLAELLDDELVGYLRRFLVEARISAVLEPILTRVAQGTPPEEAEAQRVMQEVSRVIQRALRASRRALPEPSPPDEEAERPPAGARDEIK